MKASHATTEDDSVSEPALQQPSRANRSVTAGRQKGIEAVLALLESDLANAQQSLRRRLSEREYLWWSDLDSIPTARDNGKHFEESVQMWLSEVTSAISLRFQALLKLRPTRDDSAIEWAKDQVKSLLERKGQPREAISSLMLSFGTEPAFPPGVLPNNPCDLDGVLGRLMQDTYAHLEQVCLQSMIDPESQAGGVALSAASPPRRRIRSRYLLAIRQALFALGLSATAESVANWIAEVLGEAEFENLVKNYGARADLGVLYRKNPKFKAQFNRDVTKMRSLLK